jgi:hypothetical protein
MTHVSRPFQIGLAAVLLFGAVWFAVLRGHSSGSEGSGSAASSNVQPAAPRQASGSSSGSGPSAGSSPSADSTYHGSAPGVAGLTRAIAKARGAVAQQSQQSARELHQKSQQGSASSHSTQSSKSRAPSAAHAKTAPTAAAKAAPTAAAKAHAAPTAAAKHAGKGIPAMQAKVERQLEHGKVVAILFWNPKGSVDAIVQREVHAARRNLGGRLAVDVARAGEVGSFGTFTHAVQVYSTPTILMVNTKGVTSTVSGLTDAFAIQQAVKEVKRAR